MNDKELSKSVLDSVSAYSTLVEDPDGFRLGEKYCEAVEQKMEDGVQEVFNRVAKDGLKAHGNLQPIFENISGLNDAQRKSAYEIYKALRNVTP